MCLRCLGFFPFLPFEGVGGGGEGDLDDSIFDAPLSACLTQNCKRALDEEDATTPPQTTPSRAKRPRNLLSSKASSSTSL